MALIAQLSIALITLVISIGIIYYKMKTPPAAPSVASMPSNFKTNATGGIVYTLADELAGIPPPNVGAWRQSLADGPIAPSMASMLPRIGAASMAPPSAASAPASTASIMGQSSAGSQASAASIMGPFTADAWIGSAGAAIDPETTIHYHPSESLTKVASIQEGGSDPNYVLMQPNPAPTTTQTNPSIDITIGRLLMPGPAPAALNLFTPLATSPSLL